MTRLCPAQPITDPAGCVPAEHEHRPARDCAEGRRPERLNELSTILDLEVEEWRDGRQRVRIARDNPHVTTDKGGGADRR